MPDQNPGTVTRLLARAQDGDRAALDELFPLIYDELTMLARRHRRRWHGDYTLDTSALVHEAYLKLVDQQRVEAGTRTHFMAIASKAMRHILCNYARDRGRQKRGGGLPHVSLDDIGEAVPHVVFSNEQAAVLLSLDEALRRLEAIDRRQSDVVECRFFGGLSTEETAAALGTSPATVKRTWSLARAWLYREMRDGERG